jgi:AcrR family transcriptional regulator
MADAGLTRGSFYSYFESKGDLYAEAVTQILNEKQLLSSDGVGIALSLGQWPRRTSNEWRQSA